jgi:uncharacterized YigZ family protein
MVTLAETARAETRILRSRFLAVVSPISDAEEFKAILAEIATEHRTANHHCWAYILGMNGELMHCSDAGEPSGSAGKPMLNVLRRNNLSNVGAIVTRYFGGIKLGVRGLIEAYSEAVETAMKEVTPIPLVRRVSWVVEAPYDLLETLKHRLKGLSADCDEFEFAETATFAVTAEEAVAEMVEGLLRDFAVGRIHYRLRD